MKLDWRGSNAADDVNSTHRETDFIRGIKLDFNGSIKLWEKRHPILIN